MVFDFFRKPKNESLTAEEMATRLLKEVVFDFSRYSSDAESLLRGNPEMQVTGWAKAGFKKDALAFELFCYTLVCVERLVINAANEQGKVEIGRKITEYLWQKLGEQVADTPWKFTDLKILIKALQERREVYGEAFFEKDSSNILTYAFLGFALDGKPRRSADSIPPMDFFDVMPFTSYLGYRFKSLKTGCDGLVKYTIL